MVGNVLADFIGGKIDVNLPEGIRKGIVLHREIDTYTDAHPVVREGKHQLFDVYRHYSAVILDVFYDHFLAVDWLQYYPEPLETYAEAAYEVLYNKQALLPASMLPVIEAMKRQNWLVNYGTIEGMDRALTRMSERTRFVSGMETATDELEKNYTFYQENFRHFFPDLIRHSAQWRAENG